MTNKSRKRKQARKKGRLFAFRMGLAMEEIYAGLEWEYMLQERIGTVGREAPADILAMFHEGRAHRRRCNECRGRYTGVTG